MFRNAYSFHVSLLIRVLIRVQNCDNTKTQWQREKYTDYPNDSNSAYKGEKRSEEGEREGGGESREKERVREIERMTQGERERESQRSNRRRRLSG